MTRLVIEFVLILAGFAGGWYAGRKYGSTTDKVVNVLGGK
jgi:hypothetical protein